MNTGSETGAPTDLEELARALPDWARELGFRELAITTADPGPHAEHLRAWLARGDHGDMHYMRDQLALRARPDALMPGVQRVICVVMDYLTEARAVDVLRDPQRAYIARYALGRDYHKMMRKRLARLAGRIQERAGGRHRAFVDSAPVLERACAERAGLGWIGKNTLLLNRRAGSWFFLGEIYTDLPLPVSEPTRAGHCGSCRACLDICPTDAFRGPQQLDARRCISYLTIENRGPIPEELRHQLGNRVFGCDDCQLICPWNRFARHSGEEDFRPRHGLDDSALLTLFAWTEEEFLTRTAGSAIRRAGYHGWLRNLAVALGNAPRDPAIIRALEGRLHDPSSLVAEHVGWALRRQRGRPGQILNTVPR